MSTPAAPADTARPITHSLERAAEILGDPFTVDWLKGRAKRREIPHIKTGNGHGRGGRLGFTDAHLAEIVSMFEERPNAPTPPPPPDQRAPVTRRSGKSS